MNTSYSHTSTFTYDGVNRLSTAVATGNSAYNLTYGYDQYGNGTCVVNGNTQGLCPQYSFNSGNNHITNTGYTYDAAGNITMDGQYDYQYDAEGRPVHITNNPPATWYQTSVYNALGQDVDDITPDGQYTRQLIYPRGLDGHRTQVFDVRPSINWVGSDIFQIQLDGLLIQMGGSSSYLLHADAIGTTTVVTDQAGNVNNDVLSYPWGQWFRWAGPGIWASYARLGLIMVGDVYPAQHRDYQATLGRWLTPDPGGVKVVKLTNPQTWNMYEYADDNPTTLNDPSGLEPPAADCTNQSTGCQGQKTVESGSSRKIAERLVMAAEAGLNIEIAGVKIEAAGALAPSAEETWGLGAVGAAYLGISASGNLAAAGIQTVGATTGDTKGAKAAAAVATVGTSAAGMISLVTSNGNVQESARWAAAEAVITANPDELLHGSVVEVTAKAIDYVENLKGALGF